MRREAVSILAFSESRKWILSDMLTRRLKADRKSHFCAKELPYFATGSCSITESLQRKLIFSRTVLLTNKSISQWFWLFLLLLDSPSNWHFAPWKFWRGGTLSVERTCRYWAEGVRSGCRQNSPLFPNVQLKRERGQVGRWRAILSPGAGSFDTKWLKIAKFGELSLTVGVWRFKGKLF